MTFEHPPPIILFALFVAFWCGVGFVLSRVGGWAALAEPYRLIGPFEGERWRFQTGRLNSAQYKSCLVVGANTRGMYLSVFLPFRPGHSPLFIPWSDIRSSAPIRRSFISMVELSFRRVPWVKLSLPVGLAEKFAISSMGQFTPHDA